MLLHYFASQAVFLTNVKLVDFTGEASHWSLNQVGYSPVGLLTLAVLGTLFGTIALTQGFRHLPDGMPLAASCSASISAACHPSEEDEDTWVQHNSMKVKWGVELDKQRQPVFYGEDEDKSCLGIVH